MADSAHSAPSGGCLQRLLSLAILLLVGGLGTAMYFVTQPQDLSDIGGRDPVAESESVRDLQAVLRASLERGHPLTLSETEINRWLAQTLVAKQGGPLASEVKLEGVFVRLEEGMAEIILLRRAFNHPFTISMFVKIEQTEGQGGRRTTIHRHGGPYSPDVPRPMRGGRFGRLVVPQGFLTLVIPGFSKLAEACQKEIHLAFEEMTNIRIETNRLVLDPRLAPASSEVF